jgi:winged helix DNA-binding protein
VSSSKIARQRLANQFLVGQRLAKPNDVVAALGAIQAQDYAGAKWAVAQRAQNVIESDVDDALADGSIVRTHVLRPTWHFVAPADIRWMLALTGPRINAGMTFRTRWLELDEKAFRRSEKALRRALEGTALTRNELSTVLMRARVPVLGDQRLGHLLMRAELDAVICSGPRRAKQYTYALLDDRVAASSSIDRDEALAKLAKIYFATRGPATSVDFAWWSGLTMSDARKALDFVGSELDRQVVAGPSAHLLPNFDEYFVAYKDRSAPLQRLNKAGIYPRGQDVLANAVIVDGQFVGTWKRRLKNDCVFLEINLLARLTRVERQNVAASAEKYGDFLGLSVDLSFSP